MEKKKKIRRGQIFMLIGALMIVGALGLAIFNHIKEQNVGEKSEEVLSELESLINKGKNETHVSDGEDDILEGLDEENAVKNNPEETTSSYKYWKKPTEEETIVIDISGKTESQTETETETETEPETEEPTTLPHDPNNMPYEVVDGHYFIGVLDMPTLGITLPVQWGWSDELMDISPCRYHGNTEENNIILMAHNYTTHFGALFNINPGDPVTFTDVNGHKITYHVYYIDNFHRKEISKMYEGEWDMTLFTCVPHTYNRLAVRLVRVDG